MVKWSSINYPRWSDERRIVRNIDNRFNLSQFSEAKSQPDQARREYMLDLERIIMIFHVEKWEMQKTLNECRYDEAWFPLQISRHFTSQCSSITNELQHFSPFPCICWNRQGFSAFPSFSYAMKFFSARLFIWRTFLFLRQGKYLNNHKNLHFSLRIILHQTNAVVGFLEAKKNSNASPWKLLNLLVT